MVYKAAWLGTMSLICLTGDITDAEREKLKPAACDMGHHHQGMKMNPEMVK